MPSGTSFQFGADGRFFDFHALRHHFVSKIAAAGVLPKVVQSLARHSTITMTMDRYTHLGLLDTSNALDKLPALPVTAVRIDCRTPAGYWDGRDPFAPATAP